MATTDQSQALKSFLECPNTFVNVQFKYSKDSGEKLLHPLTITDIVIRAVANVVEVFNIIFFEEEEMKVGATASRHVILYNN